MPVHGGQKDGITNNSPTTCQPRHSRSLNLPARVIERVWDGGLTPSPVRSKVRAA